MVFIVVICIVAGIGAGLVTGLAGLSAAVIIAPLLTTLLGLDPYMAVGIALASDVLASAGAAILYKHHKNIDIVNGVYMMITTIIFTFIGSYIAAFLPSTTMGHITRYIMIIVGLRFVIKPAIKSSERNANRSKSQKIILSSIAGVIIGLVCGIAGAGGGLTMLLVLTSLLGYDLKTAVGTSVFIMAFTALTGSISHFVLGYASVDWMVLIICVITTLLGSILASLFANKIKPTTVNRVTGLVLVIVGAALLIIEYANLIDFSNLFSNFLSVLI